MSDSSKSGQRTGTLLNKKSELFVESIRPAFIGKVNNENNYFYIFKDLVDTRTLPVLWKIFSIATVTLTSMERRQELMLDSVSFR